MPTFINNSLRKTMIVENIFGKKEPFAPGETIESYKRLDVIFADVELQTETPYINNVMRFIPITFGGVETKEIELTDNEIINGGRITIKGETKNLTIEVKFNSDDSANVIWRKLVVNAGFAGMKYYMKQDVAKIFLTSNRNGVAQVYIEK